MLSTVDAKGIQYSGVDVPQQRAVDDSAAAGSDSRLLTRWPIVYWQSYSLAPRWNVAVLTRRSLTTWSTRQAL